MKDNRNRVLAGGSLLLIVCMFALLALMAGCTSLGLATPTSPSQQIAYDYGVVAGMRESAAQALSTGAITVTQAQEVLAITDTARTALDTAKGVLGQPQPGDVSSNLAQVSELILQVQTILPKGK